MNLCTVQPGLLQATINAGVWPALPASLAACLAMWGYGMLAERGVRRLSRMAAPHGAPMDWAYAFVQGVIVTSLILFVLSVFSSLFGGWMLQAAWPIFIGGIVAGVAALRMGPRRFTPVWPGWSQLSPFGRLLLVIGISAGLFFLTGPMVLMPAQLSDLTAIWMLKAKALSCAGIFETYLNREPVWTGTHPEYPLLFPLIQSFVFRLAETFRDDITRLWVWAVWFAAAWKWGTWSFENLRSVWIRALALLWMLVLATHLAWDGRPELVVAALSLLVAVAWVERDYVRLPLLLFGMAFTKQDGLAIAMVFAVCVGWMWWGSRKTFTRAEAKRLGWGAVVFFGLTLCWVIVQKQLPNLHEQYGQRLLSPVAWKEGLAHWPEIFWENFVRLFRGPWALFFPVVVVGTVFWIRYARRSLVAMLFLWSAGCFWLFHVAHVVSPWGTGLSMMAMSRILTEFYLPLSVGACLWLDEVWRHPAKARRYFMPVLIGVQLLVTIGFSAPQAMQNIKMAARPSASFWLHEDRRVNAVQLDQSLGTLTRGVILNDWAFFHMNYLLFPRRLYPNAPNALVGTWRPWRPWTNLDDIGPAREAFEFGIEFVVDGGSVIWKSP